MADSTQDKALQKKLVGAGVLILLAVIFIPMIFDCKKPSEEEVSMQIKLPPKKIVEIPNRLGPASEPTPPLAVQPEQEADVVVPLVPAVEDTEKPAPAPAAAVIPPPVPAPVVKPVVAERKPEPAKVAPKPAEPKPVTKAPETAKAPVAAGSFGESGFVVQVGSFSQERNAAVLASRLASSGFPAFVERSNSAGKWVYRVKVGPRPSRNAADDLRQRLIDKEQLQGIIVTYP